MDTIEVRIGVNENNQSSILKGVNGETVAIEWSHKLLNCDEGRWLWVSWADGFIQLGQGSVVGVRPIVWYQNPDAFPVHAVALASSVDALWEFANVPSNSQHHNVRIHNIIILHLCCCLYQVTS